MYYMNRYLFEWPQYYICPISVMVGDIYNQQHLPMVKSAVCPSTWELEQYKPDSPDPSKQLSKERGYL